jgi:Fic family protein
MKSLNDRQEYIQKYIQEKEEVKISDIFAHVRTVFDIDRRTVIRDLDILLNLKYISKHGAGRGVAYSVSDQFNFYKKINVEEYFSVSFDEREIKTSFNFDIFTILQKSIFTKSEEEKLNQLHNEFTANFSKYDSQTLINKEFERILIEFSWKSSQIEGNTYSLLSTEQLIKENKKDEKKTEAETQMILNHKDAFNEALQNRDAFMQLSRSNIEHIHRLLTKNLSVSRNLRKSPVGITGTKYKPLDNIYQIEEAFAMMIDLINTKKSFFEKAFLSLILLSYIQAFEDGNKRTARMISNAILLSYQSIPMSYRAVNEIEYKKASLLFYEVNNLTYFKEIFIKQFEFAVKNYFK